MLIGVHFTKLKKLVLNDDVIIVTSRLNFLEIKLFFDDVTGGSNFVYKFVV